MSSATSSAFWGTFLALVAVLALMGKARSLGRGPRQLFKAVDRLLNGAGSGKKACKHSKKGKKKGSWRVPQTQRPGVATTVVPASFPNAAGAPM